MEIEEEPKPERETQKKRMRRVEMNVVMHGASGAEKMNVARHFIKVTSEITRSEPLSVLVGDWKNLDDWMVQFRMMDFPSSLQHYRTLSQMYYKRAAVALVVYDITDMDTFEFAKSLVEDVQQKASSKLVIALCGNKAHLETERKVDFEEAKAYADSMDLVFMEASTETGMNVNEIINTAALIYLRERQHGVDSLPYVRSLPEDALTYGVKWGNEGAIEEKIIDSMEKDWVKKLAPHLRLTDKLTARREALMKWKHRQGPLATYYELLKAFCRAGYAQGAEEISEILKTKNPTVTYKHHLEEALKTGTVLVGIITCIILGCAGAGKTCLKHVMLGLVAPYLRTTTPCKDEVARIELHDVKLTKFQLDGQQSERRWKEIDSEHLRRIVADAVSSMEFGPTDSSDEEKVPQALGIKDRLANFFFKGGKSSQNPSEKNQPSQGSGVSRSLTSRQSNGELVSKQSSNSSGDVEEALDAIKAQITKLLVQNRGTSQLSMKDRSKWLYLTDSGGQPQFIEVLPLFMHSMSGAIYVFRLCDELDKPNPVEYYKNGVRVGCQTSHATALDTLKYLIQMIKSRPAGHLPPKLLIVGTHEDHMSDCVNETLADKNAKVRRMLQECGASDIVSPASISQIIYTVNSLSPEDVDVKDSVKNIQASVESLPCEEITFPIWWYVFELLLQKLGGKLGRKVLRRSECQQLATHLGFSEAEFEACLEFLHIHNVIHYNPKILKSVVFVDSQIPVDKLSELVEFSCLLREMPDDLEGLIESLYPDSPINVADPKWKRFSNQGILTVNSLNEFRRHYVEDLFSCVELCLLLKSLLVLVPLDLKPTTGDIAHDVEYFMPCLLDYLQPEIVDEYRRSNSISAPLLLCFKQGLPHPGIFCCLVAYLIKEGHWKIALTPSGDPVMVKRNCITFTIFTSPPCRVTLIDSLSFVEIHVKFDPELPREDCGSVLPEIQCIVKSGIIESSHVLHYGITQLEYAFFCFSDHSYHQQTGQGSYHICKLGPKQKYLICEEGSELTSQKMKPRHSVWWTGEAPSLDSSTQGYLGKKYPTLADLLLVERSHGSKSCFRLLDRLQCHWKAIGEVLGLEPVLLETIKKSKTQELERTVAVFTVWLENACELPRNEEYPLSWKGLRTLLFDAEVAEIAVQYFEFLENIAS